MKVSHHRSVAITQPGQHGLYLILVVDPSLVDRTRAGPIQRRLVSRHMPQRFGLSATSYLADHHTSSNDGQVGCQGTPSTKTTQSGKIVSQQRQKDLRTQVIDVVRGESHTASVGSVIDHVDEQPDESVYEISPRTGMMFQATGEQTAIDFGECQRNARG